MDCPGVSSPSCPSGSDPEAFHGGEGGAVEGFSGAPLPGQDASGVGLGDEKAPGADPDTVHEDDIVNPSPVTGITGCKAQHQAVS